jgi:hypothetical protein
MNTRTRLALIFSLLLLAGLAFVAVSGATQGSAPAQGGAPALAGAPPAVAYQGEVRIGGAPYNDTGLFKFAIVDKTGSEIYWANDDTHDGEPVSAVPLEVNHGLFSVLLGDVNLEGMEHELTAEAFQEPDTYLRVWFSASPGGPFQWLEPDMRIAAVPYALQAELAANADTVDGLHAADLETHYHNVVVVAKSGGDYTTVQAAINSIVDATASNPYLVWVAPGVYSEQVTMAPHVHLQGAGQEATVISSTASSGVWPPGATLTLASDTSLRDLTVGNAGTGQYNAALLATAGATRTVVAGVTARAQGTGSENYGLCLTGSSTGAALQQVTALAENGSSVNNGLRNYDGAAATVRGGSFTARGGSSAYGLFNNNYATLDAEGVTALGVNGTYNRGLDSGGFAEATLRGGSFTGRGGRGARGISNYNGALQAEGVTAVGEGGWETNLGLSIGSQAATVLGGSFTGSGGTEARGIRVHGATATLEAEGVIALGHSGTLNNFGLYIHDGAASTLRSGAFTGRGGETALGIYNWGSGAKLEAASVTALGENGTSTNCGLNGSGGSAATLHGGSFTALSEGTSSNYGLYGYDTVTTTVRGASFIARGGTDAWGIYNSGSTAMEAENVTALAEGATFTNYGLYNHEGAATVHGGAFTARGDGATWGIFNTGATATLQAEGVSALGENSSFNYGLHNTDGVVKADSSQFTGDTDKALYQDGGTIYLGVSQLDGGHTLSGGGSLNCFQVYDGSYTAYDCTP